MTEWIKDGFFYRKQGGARDGCEDLVFNTCKRIVDTEDHSDWAKASVMSCSALLSIGRRWPIRMDVEGQAPNWIIWRLHKLLGIKKYKYRSADDLTRDPWRLLYTAAVMHNRYDIIRDTPIPIRLYSHTTWKRRRTLLNDKRDLYVNRLEYYDSKADVIDYERKHPEMP